MFSKLFSIFLIMVMSVFVLAQIPTVRQPRVVNLTGYNTIVFSKDVNEQSAQDLIRAITSSRYILPARQTLYIVIDSGGGEYDAGMKIMPIIRASRNTQILCHYCASMASEMFAASRLHRMITDKSHIMMHEMYIEHVTAKQIVNKSIVADLSISSEAFNLALYKTIGMSRLEYEKRITNTEWHLYGKDIIRWHLADEYVIVHCDLRTKFLQPNLCQ